MSCAVSSCASWLAYATPTRLRVYRLGGCGRVRDPAAPPTLSRVKAPATAEPLHHLAFFTGRIPLTEAATEAPAEDLLLAVTAEGGLHIYSLDGGSLCLVSSLLAGELQLSGGGPVVQVSVYRTRYLPVPGVGQLSTLMVP